MLTTENTEAIRRIEEAIGYTFHDKRLLIQVLTRKTYLKIDPEAPDNEVLEFYGDTLMNYHVTNYFMSKYAHMLDDGLFFMRTVEQFTDMRSHYVCNRYLTDRIKAMGLARYLRAQNRDSELRRDGEKAYADIFESLVGAIYLDSYQNDNLIRAFILRQLGIEPKRAPEEIESFDYDSLAGRIPTEDAAPEATPALSTEETEQAVEIPAPDEIPVTVTEALEETPEEMPAALSNVTPSAEIQTIAEPVTEAIAAAVEEATPALLPAEPAPATEPAEAVPMPMQEALADLCRRRGFDQPTYGEPPKNAPNARPVAACTMKYRDAKGKIVKISLNDSGRTLAEATEKVAAKMLKKLAAQVSDEARRETPPLREETAPVKPVETVPAAQPEVEVTSLAVIPEPMEETAPTATAVPVEPPVEDAVPDVEQLVIEMNETLPPATDQAEMATEAVAETVTEAAVEVKETAEPLPAVEESAPHDAPAEESQTEEPIPVEKPKTPRAPRKKKTESAEGEKPVRKTSPRKKAAPKTDEPASDTVGEAVTVTPASEAAEQTVTEAVAEPAAEDASVKAEAPAKTTKPRTRKPRTPKATPPEVKAEAPVATAEAETAAVGETAEKAEATPTALSDGETATE